MGGNALKLQTVRLDKKYYEYVAEGTSTVLKQAFLNAKVSVIPSYRDKETFGDLDVLISGVPMDKLREFVEKSLNSPEYRYNGNVLSFALDISALLMRPGSIFQIDFITMPGEDFDFALNYFSYNDLGNLIGQTAHGIGLKFGHNGLWYRYIVGTQLVKEVLITKDFSKALHILGYEAHAFEKGFQSLEDMFTYATSSCFFTTWNYQLENRNAEGRVRDKKRKVYMAFVEWLKDKDLPSERLSKDQGIKRAILLDRHVACDFTEATLDYLKVERVKKKFNGASVVEWTGLTGKELGEFMRDYRGPTKDAFLSRMDLLPMDQVKSNVKAFYDTWRKT